MTYININTNARWTELPQSKRYNDGTVKTGGTCLEDWLADGWRVELPSEVPAEGMIVLTWTLWTDGFDAQWRIETQMAIAEWDAQQEAARQEAERQRQIGKPLKLKQCENSFLAWCDTLTGGSSHTKLGFDQIKAIIATLPQEQQVVLAAQLQAVNSELQYEGGLKWWDDCVYHTEIVE